MGEREGSTRDKQPPTFLRRTVKGKGCRLAQGRRRTYLVGGRETVPHTLKVPAAIVAAIRHGFLWSYLCLRRKFFDMFISSLTYIHTYLSGIFCAVKECTYLRLTHDRAVLFFCRNVFFWVGTDVCTRKYLSVNGALCEWSVVMIALRQDTRRTYRAS